MPQQPFFLPNCIILWFIFLLYHYLFYYSMLTASRYSSLPLCLSFPLTFSRFLSRSPSLCPPTWSRFVSVLFSLTVTVSRLLCILRERTVCLPIPNPRPLHNYGRPWQCTGQLTPASSWRVRWQARRGSHSLSILSRQWHGQSPLPLWPVVFIKPSVAQETGLLLCPNNGVLYNDLSHTCTYTH